jgi:hypothetical protein
MTTYVAVFNLTDAGIKAAKDSRPLDAGKKLLADIGGEMKSFYITLKVFPGDRLPRDHPLARLIRVGCSLLRGPGESYSDVILRLAVS